MNALIARIKAALRSPRVTEIHAPITVNISDTVAGLEFIERHAPEIGRQVAEILKKRRGVE